MKKCVVEEEEQTERDTATGVERIELRRRLGEQERVIEQQRVAGGDIQTHEQLHGVDPSHVSDFDSEWRRRASSVVEQTAPQQPQQRMIESTEIKNNRKPTITFKEKSKK